MGPVPTRSNREPKPGTVMTAPHVHAVHVPATSSISLKIRPRSSSSCFDHAVAMTSDWISIVDLSDHSPRKRSTHGHGCCRKGGIIM